MTEEQIKQYKKTYRDKNRELLNKKAKEYTKLNPEKRREAKRKWAINNKLHKAVLNKNWNAKKLGAVGSITKEEYQALLKKCHNKCGYCFSRDAYTIDHIVPISKGGVNYISNIMPACLECNGQKANRLLSEWFALPNCYNKNKHLIDH